MKNFARTLVFTFCLSLSLLADESLLIGEEALDHEFWMSITDSKDPREFEEYLKVFPQGFFSGIAKNRIIQLEDGGSNDVLILDTQQALKSEIDRLAAELKVAERSRASLLGEVNALREELAFLRSTSSDEIEAFSKERELLVAAHKMELDILRERHLDLEKKYNRLVRPARNKTNRFVVEVRFWKEGTARRYSLRPGSGVETSVSESELHQQLTKLKAKYGDELYTLVRPDDNSLTHGEAWSFTNKILNRYDYYYQN